jgi:hypothetical protein
MSAKNSHATVRYFSNLINENSTFFAEGLNNAFIMNNFMTNVNGRPVPLNSTLYNLNGALYPSAKTPWLG